MRVVIASARSHLADAQAWDRFVACDPRGHLLQTWAWGDLKGAFGWHPVRLAVERDGSLIAGAQVLYRRVGPFGMGYIPKGPLLVEQDPQAVAVLWRALHERSRKMGCILLKVEPEWHDEELQSHQWLAAQGLRPSAECIQPRRTIMVGLQGSEEELLARMKPKWRYNIRLSERKGVEVREGRVADIGVFYELLRITGQRDAFGVHNLEYYRRALELFAPTGRATLLLAYHEGQPLAALIVYAFNEMAWYMYGASANERRELMPNHQLQWRAMRWAKAQGCRQYDLWGITDTDSPDEVLGGVQRFKEGFGGQVVRYVGAYDYVYSRPLYWLMSKIRAQRGV